VLTWFRPKTGLGIPPFVHLLTISPLATVLRPLPGSNLQDELVAVRRILNSLRLPYAFQHIDPFLGRNPLVDFGIEPF
jgi:hypothetical protein